MLTQNIKNLRLDAKLSQEDLSKSLGISRTTYSKIEAGKTSPTIDQLRALSKLYEVELDWLIRDLPEASKMTVDPPVDPPKNTDSQAPAETDEIIEVPEEDIEKFKQVLLYVLSEIGAKPNIGETALYKIMYFIDFDYFEKYQEKLTGARYIRNHFGPTPTSFKRVVEEMVVNEQLDITTGKHFKYKQRKYMPRTEPDLSQLSALGLEHIDKELDRLSDMNGSQLTELSHKDIPWQITKDRQPIDYMSVFYRSSDTSVRDHSDDEL